MSLSKERQEYHLTSLGWNEGSFKGDAFGGSNNVSIPVDRVLTIACYDEISSANAKPHFYDRVIWQSDDKQLLEELMVKWGERPDWFGYKNDRQ